MSSKPHMSLDERFILQALIEEELPIKDIAQKMGRSPKLVYQELSRTPYPYNAIVAQEEFENYYQNPRVMVQAQNALKRARL